TANAGATAQLSLAGLAAGEYALIVRTLAPDEEAFERSVYELVPQVGAAGTTIRDASYPLEDTGLNRMLGGHQNDDLYGGTGLDFMYGNGGDDVLYRSDGVEFEALDGTLAGDEWKEYAKSTGLVWYVGGSGGDDRINVDYVTEPGLLEGRHLITRLTENQGQFSFAAQLSLDFEAKDDDGTPIWDPLDTLTRFGGLESGDPAQQVDEGTHLFEQQIDLLQDLLPPEQDFLAILVDALAGDDEVIVGPTVQRTVWIDLGAGDDRAEILGGTAILVDRAEGDGSVARNDLPDNAFLLGAPPVLIGSVPVGTSGQLSGDAVFTLEIDGVEQVEVTVSQASTQTNATAGALAADINFALKAAGIDEEVRASWLDTGADRFVALSRTRVASYATLEIVAANQTAISELGF
ncbi:MAG: hypothetical protein L0206_11035, partial [Actinobacteria bacterium]|nr:hypothetical protein [Actinomycetota bacterium]